MGSVRLVPPDGFSHRELVSPDAQVALPNSLDETVFGLLRLATVARSANSTAGPAGFARTIELSRAPSP